ncbi:F0F1 ATP synthase subunit epsilon [Terricaulis silvestris]|uniref:ATP synthase epsilon chain n=1 Tax=Terricaulis silvestris TaxID=2686094 RepID=A0A6I6MWX5_9CAUL|nr:F0F1 ATP synthase subunit epsilon [Terricaulis silvestris]QGZ96894.1 F-ATPase epsilon subunit [Terricaulis silvestris]
MADKLHFALVSPERELFNGEVDHVVVPGSEGEFGVSPNHAPVMSVIKPGALKVINEGTERRIFVNGGFADVTPEGLSVLAEEAIDLADVDLAQLEQQLKNAQDDLRDANTDDRRAAAQRALSRVEGIKAALAR